MRIVLLLVLFVGCGSNGESQKISDAEKREKNEERRHNEMMAEMEAAHLDRLKTEIEQLRKQQSQLDHDMFDRKFQK